MGDLPLMGGSGASVGSPRISGWLKQRGLAWSCPFDKALDDRGITCCAALSNLRKTRVAAIAAAMPEPQLMLELVLFADGAYHDRVCDIQETGLAIPVLPSSSSSSSVVMPVVVRDAIRLPCRAVADPAVVVKPVVDSGRTQGGHGQEGTCGGCAGRGI